TSQQIVVSICIRRTYDTVLLNANSSDSTALFQQVVQGLTTTFTSSPGIAAIQPIGFAPGCGGVVSTVQCAVAPFALQTVSNTFQTLQVNLGVLTIDPAVTTVVSAATRRTVIVTVELTLTYIVDYQDTSSEAYTNLSVTIENAVLQVFAANPADIQSVAITSVAPGASATSTSVTVSVVTLGANVNTTTQIIVNTTSAGVQLGNLPIVSSTVGDTTPPCRAVADIVFLVDGTGSVGLENFERMKTFIRQLFAYLDIGENAVRVSIVQYAAQARTEFFLDQYYDLQEAQDAVDGIEYMGGYTLTGKAIDFATNLHFDLRKGARADVTKIAVVITDGISYDDVNRPARRMRQAGIVTIAVGVGNNLDRDQLTAIAGDAKTLLSLDDFDRLQDLTTSLPTMLCDVGTSQQIVVSICIRRTYDTVLLNANSSDSTALFRQVVQGLTTTFTSSPGIAAIQPIGFAPGCGGVVSTVQCAVAPFALQTVSNTFQTLQVNLGVLTIDPAVTTVVPAATRRTVIVTVELTLTYIVDYQDTSSEAYTNLSVTIENVLQVFAANPADIQSVAITSVAPGASATSTSVTVSVVTLGANVNTTTQIIVNTTSAGVQLGNLPIVSSTVGDTTPLCRAVADIVFLVDGTGSVGLDNFERMKTFIRQLFAYLDIGENAVRVSIVQYAAQARTEFFLDQYYDLQEAQDAVDGIEYMGGYTLTGKAIDFATNLHFDLRKGARADVTKIAVVITDGISYDDVNRPARRMRQAGIVTIAVGVGNNLDRDQLTAIAGDAKTLLSLDDFDRLQDLTTSLPTMLCDVGTSQQIVVSICIRRTYDTVLLNANSSDSTALFRQVVQGLTTTFTSSPGIAAIQPIGFAPGCGGVVSTVQCAVAPFALQTVSNTFQTLQVNFGVLRIDPAVTTVVPAATRRTVIVTVELTLTYIVDYQDTSSEAYTNLSVTIENAVLQVFAANPADIQSVAITSVAPGASATSTSVTVSVVTLGANVNTTTQIIVNTTSAGVQLGNLPIVSSTVGDTTPLCRAVADIVFLVDGTGSVGLDNFERMKTFIRQLFAYLDIGENAVRVSIVQYAAQARTEFFLDQYYDLQEAQDAVDGIEYMGGYTLTGKAIDFATNLHFDLRKGARADVTKIAVVITDGISYDDVNRPARRMRQAGIVTIAVGVGNNLDRDQLTAIAGDAKTLLSLDDFDRLQDLTTSLPTMLCDVGTSQQIVVSICIRRTYDTVLLNANSSDSTALFRQVVQGLTTTFTSSPGIAAIQPIGFAPGCGGVVSTVQCAVAPFALQTVSNTFQTLQVNLGVLTIDPAVTTVVPAATRRTVIVTVELTLTYIVDYQDTSSEAYTNLSVTIENAVLQVFAANPADIQSVAITSVAPGASATSTSVTVSVVTLGANVNATTQIIVNTTSAGVQLGNLPIVSSTVGDTTPPCRAVADIVFLVDGTGSVGLDNFERMKTFIRQLFAYLDIGENAVRVSIVQYAAQARTEFFLDQYYDLQEAQDAVDGIDYMGGYTLTGKAIDFATNLHFDLRKGARADVTKIAVVITDGRSYDDVNRPARRMRQAGIVTIAVGVGNNLDRDQLTAIAGDPKTLLSLDGFDRLQDLTTSLPTMLCDVGTSQQIVVSICITTTYGTDLLNANSSDSTALFQQVVQGLTTTFTNSPGIAAVQPIGFAPGCGGVVSTVQCSVAPFALATVSDTFQNLQGTLGALTVGPAGATVVSAATRTTVIVTVELTLPYTVDLQDTSSQAYTNLSVTIENAVLQVFAANPADIQSVSITSVAPGATATSTSVTVSVVTLGANVDVTTQIIVNTTAAGVQLGNLPVVSSTVGDTTPPCRAVADIVFLVDGTGSVGLENFERMKTFIRQLFAYLDIGENAVRVSIVQYAAQARTEFFLDQYYDLQEAQDAVDGIDYMGGYTLTGKAIDFATNLHFDLRKGARADVTKIAVVITDGISYDDVNRPARRMRQAGIVTIAVGVGNNLDRDQLTAIAGDPKTLLSLDGFDRLQDLTTSLPTMICDVGTSQQIVVSICITTTYGTDLLNANSSDSTALFQQVVQGVRTDHFSKGN
ncbi:collagen alpha-3(VI) chain-like, partial [Branchiostoma floridae]|uniref:Collagen alpha-3(VI) chain-like n=1 Tax=Branchiostoma floridae TaxID=7739 RepID=A0A9J7N474_BRAFL